MSYYSMYSKAGIQVPDTRVSKLTAAIIFLLFAATLYFAYEKYLPELEAHNKSAESEPTVSANTSTKTAVSTSPRPKLR